MSSIMNSTLPSAAAVPVPGERTLLIVEDDRLFLQRLARAMEGRGFLVATAESVADGLLQVEKTPPAFAVVDMRLGDGNGLDVILAMKKRRPEARAIILTGYGNIATAVNAVKLGAVDYLAKPVDADDVAAALLVIDEDNLRCMIIRLVAAKAGYALAGAASFEEAAKFARDASFDCITLDLSLCQHSGA